MYILKNGQPYLAHSAKGSEWKKHMYIKRIDGTYYYPDDYEGGRHLPHGRKKDSNKNESDEERDRLDREYDNDLHSIEKTVDELGGWEAFLSKITDKSDTQVNNFKAILKNMGMDVSDLSDQDTIDLFEDLQESYLSGKKFTQTDIENLANEVIRGNFGNGETRKDLLGENYDAVQARVNEILGAQSAGNRSISEAKNNITEEVKKLVEDAVVNNRQLNWDEVYAVYGGLRK